MLLYWRAWRLNENGVAQANMGIAFGDYMHTGRMSLAIAHFDDEYMALYRNDGGMNFTDDSLHRELRVPRTATSGGAMHLSTSQIAAGRIFSRSTGMSIRKWMQAHAGHCYREPAVLLLNQHDGTFAM